MAERLIDPLVRLGIRHEWVLGRMALAWFALSCAAASGFVALPDIPYVTDRNAWMISAPVNALWWGWLRPAIERRKAALAVPGKKER